MTGGAFIDTNVWVHAVDGADPRKQQRAIKAIEQAAGSGIVLSTQVQGEFHVTVAARTAGVTRFLTEDLADGATYGSVRVESPFRGG